MNATATPPVVMGLRMRLTIFFVMTPALAAAIAHGPFMHFLRDFSVWLPAGVTNSLEILPFSINTTIILLGCAVWYAGALVVARPHFWLGVGTAGALAFGTFPFGLVRWSIVREVFAGQGPPHPIDWLWMVLPVFALLGLLLLERLLIDARTFGERGIDSQQIRSTIVVNSVWLFLTLLALTVAAAGVTYGFVLLMEGGAVQGLGSARAPTLAVAAILLVVATLIMVRAPSSRSDPGAGQGDEA